MTRMKNSSILKLVQNNKNSSKSKTWIHPPENLQNNHIAYLVKASIKNMLPFFFLGCTEVDQPKGIEVVKEGIRKLTFNQQLKKAEGSSSKPPKVELTISVDGVAIQEPKTKEIMYQYPLHRISYCADDKAEKRFFSFIAKESSSTEKHTCFVFVSDKLAEEITLTIGQAFDLAYRRFLESQGKDIESKKQAMVLHKRVEALERENKELRARLQELSQLLSPDALQGFMSRKNIPNLLIVDDGDEVSMTSTTSQENGKHESEGILEDMLLIEADLQGLVPPPVPPRNDPDPAVGRHLENLQWSDLEDLHNPLNGSSSNGSSPPIPSLSPPPSKGREVPPPPIPARNLSGPALKDIFGSEPFASSTRLADPMMMHPSQSMPVFGQQKDLFGMGDFSSPTKSLEQSLSSLEGRISDMQDGFHRGLAIEKQDFEEFSLDSLDPLRN
ncbi:unnamed protein product [Darwinula stevensoni]|uniref:PID domain-containing protein n=1 Tax=Darwinula stevensoni TaxID=69355 RepID=A0A7R8XAL3_9CRUS|nr:unnamed protein product [Darwinula stevensoni]CAG0883893.1 unnamed protein product [Darwinula stevensoni]